MHKREQPMNDTKTLELLHSLRLTAMADVYTTALQLGTAHTQPVSELLAYMVEAEINRRRERKSQRLIKQAQIRIPASLEEVDLSPERGIPQGLFTSLATLDWVNYGHTLLVTGKTGSGKSFFASALAYESCLQGIKTFYVSASKLFLQFRMAKGDGSYLDELQKLAKIPVVVIDDFGLAPLTQEDCLIFYDVLEDRYHKTGTIITSQLPVTAWHSLLLDPTLADAIMDRIAHTPYKIDMKGGSQRRKHQTD
jgi:DNA replication protein DnaC